MIQITLFGSLFYLLTNTAALAQSSSPNLERLSLKCQVGVIRGGKTVKQLKAVEGMIPDSESTDELGHLHRTLTPVFAKGAKIAERSVTYKSSVLYMDQEGTLEQFLDLERPVHNTGLIQATLSTKFKPKDDPEVVNTHFYNEFSTLLVQREPKGIYGVLASTQSFEQLPYTGSPMVDFFDRIREKVSPYFFAYSTFDFMRDTNIMVQALESGIVKRNELVAPVIFGCEQN